VVITSTWLSAANRSAMKVKLLTDVHLTRSGRTLLWLELRSRCLSVGCDETDANCYVEQPASVAGTNRTAASLQTD